MPREIPDVPKGWQPPQPGSGRSYEIELITPMFGGGVSTRVNDPSLPIRPTSIQGQLQFWWRATVGAQYETTKRLRKEQSKVWGDTKQASRVQVRVEVLQVDPPAACARFAPDNKDNSRYRSMPIWNAPFNNTALPYTLFPFQGQLANGRRQIEIEPACCIHNAKFRLTIICHKDIDFAKQVEPALWAWVNFGGLGSRTRRGCGALYCQQLAPPDLDSIDSWYRDRVPAISDGVRDWPTMPTQFLCYPQTGKPFHQWNRVIALFRDFRQKPGNGPGHARPPGPDRSWYPEPDTIRRITGSHSPGHDPSQHLSGGSPLPDGFPRAEFGLPIVFKFIDDKKGDPKRTTLQPYVGGQENDKGTPDSPDIHVTGGEITKRMASPLVLRPLALTKEVAVAIILPLQTRGVSHVALVSDNGSDLIPRHAVPVRDASFIVYPDSPIRGLTSSGSALDAFLKLAVQAARTNAVHPDTGYRRAPR
jgi:CRISPR-associated protein Cmr1